MVEITSLDVRLYLAVTIVVVSFLAAIVQLYIYTKGPSKKADKIITTPILSKRKVQGPFEMSEVALHNTSQDCWIVVDDKVYDVTGRYG